MSNKDLAQQHENIKMLKIQKEYEECNEYGINDDKNELDDENDWTWYDHENKDIAFVVSTNFP